MSWSQLKPCLRRDKSQSRFESTVVGDDALLAKAALSKQHEDNEITKHQFQMHRTPQFLCNAVFWIRLNYALFSQQTHCRSEKRNRYLPERFIDLALF
jgi:hypothetical protein